MKNTYEKVKKWREQNKDKHRAQWLKYYQDHKEVLKEKRRIRYQNIINLKGENNEGIQVQ